MSKKRVYTEEEIAEIFRQAASDQEIWKAKNQIKEGLTLEELQKIGSEAGITPAFIERAAAIVGDKPIQVGRETLFNIPFGVSRTHYFPEKFTDAEWENLVVLLRQAYQNEGELYHVGAFRSWKTENVSVIGEPYLDGYRVTLTSSLQRFGVSTFSMTLGAISFLISLLFWFQLLFSGQFTWALLAPAIVLSVLAAIVFLPITMSPRWARAEEQRLDQIISGLKSRMSMDNVEFQTEQEALQHTVEGTISLKTDDQGISERESKMKGRTRNRH